MPGVPDATAPSQARYFHPGINPKHGVNAKGQSQPETRRADRVARVITIEIEGAPKGLRGSFPAFARSQDAAPQGAQNRGIAQSGKLTGDSQV